MPTLTTEQKNALEAVLEKNGVLAFLEEFLAEHAEAKVYLVGGMVRDLFLNRSQKVDIDLVVSHVPAKALEAWLSAHGDVDLVGKHFGVLKFRPAGFPEGVESLDIALPRTDHAFLTGGYHDFEIQSDPELAIEKDLERRDFTVNAMAVDLKTFELIDIFHGMDDLKKKIIRTVNDPHLRFSEDATRMMRAVRFSCQLGFEIEPNTANEIKKQSATILKMPVERIREELNKILESDRAEYGIRLMEKIGLLQHVIPELCEGIGVTQNKSHIYTVFEHNLRALGTAVERGYSLTVRLAALFHDIGKPQTKRGEGYNSTFYNHDHVGGRMVSLIMNRLKYPKDMTRQVSHLVRNHMFYYSLGEVSDAGIRRLIARLGSENIHDFIHVRICDRLGMGRPKAKPYKLLEMERRIQTVALDPLHPKMMKLRGDDVMKLLSITPSPRIGRLLKALFAEVLDEPKKNTREYLEARLLEIKDMSDEELDALAPELSEYEEDRRKEVLKKYREAE